MMARSAGPTEVPTDKSAPGTRTAVTNSSGGNGSGAGRVGAEGTQRTVRVPKTAELVAGALRRQIIRGELREDDALPTETILMEQFGVSRPTLREAFRVLESEALISVRRGAHGGARVHIPDSDVAARYAGLVLQYRGATVADVLEARAMIEPPCAGRLAARRTANDLKRLWRAVDDADSVIDDPELGIHLQQEFHALIVDLAGNGTAALLAAMLRRIIDVATFEKVAREAGKPSERQAQHTGHRSHRRLVEHIEARDSQAAEQLWRKHIVESSAYILKGSGTPTLIELIG